MGASPCRYQVRRKKACPVRFKNYWSDYQDSSRLVSFGLTAPIAQEFMLGYDYLDWRESETPFASMGSWSGVGDCDLGVRMALGATPGAIARLVLAQSA